MKPLKIVFGVLAIIWMVAHLVQPLVRGVPTGEFATSWWMGKVTAICVGLIVAIVCLKPSKARTEKTNTGTSSRPS